MLAPPIIIEAPQPPDDDPATGSLFGVFPPTDPPGRWAAGGVTWDPAGNCGTVTRWADCSGALRPVAPPPAPPVFRPFQVVSGYRCSTLGSVEDPGRYARQAEAALNRHASTQAEAELWTGALTLANGWENPFLTDGNATRVAGGTLLPWSFGLARLLGDMRACLGSARGVIHMAPFVLPILLRLGGLRYNETLDRVESPFGDLVIAGSGYPGGGDAANTVYQISTAGAVGGTFTLTVTNPLNGIAETTDPIAYDANVVAVALALQELSFIDIADITGSGGPLPAALAIQFKGDLAGLNVTVTGNSDLTGGNLAVGKTAVGGSVQPDDHESSWVYATGPLVTYAGPVEITPVETRDVDLLTNTITVFAERPVLTGFDPCCHLAVRLDLTDSGETSGGIDTGGLNEIDGGDADDNGSGGLDGGSA